MACGETLLLEVIGLRLVFDNDEPKPLTAVEQSASATSFDLEMGASAASRSHIKTSPPRPPEANKLLYNTVKGSKLI